jgi:hypothetical protein
MPAAAIIGGALQLGAGIFGASKARREAARMRQEAARLQGKLDSLEANRQQIINPYENITDLSSSLMEQSDIALANTLDTIRATGGGAGSATALAQAALQAKKGVAANIEQQEVANERQRAQGEATLQQQIMSEKQRVQQAEVAGDQFVFQQRENREMMQLDRLSNQIGALRGGAAQASADATAAITGAVGGLMNTATSAGLFGS